MSCKKVTFDDNIQIIGVSDLHIDHEREKDILSHFIKQQTIHNNPKKLFSQQSESGQEAPAFLQGLQSLVAQRSHTILNTKEGLKPTRNDIDQSGETYIKDEKTGAWVSKSQQEAKGKMDLINQKWQQETQKKEPDPGGATSPAFLQNFQNLMGKKTSEVPDTESKCQEENSDKTTPSSLALSQNLLPDRRLETKESLAVINKKWEEENSEPMEIECTKL